MSCILRISSDNVVTVDGVRNRSTGDYINDATVELTLLDENGDEIAGQSWPVTMAYVVGSSGKYRATVEDSISVSDGDEGTAILDVTGDGLTAQLKLPVTFETWDQTQTFWTSRSELDSMFGSRNVDRWADLEGDADAENIANRIRWAVDEATDEARLLLKGSPANTSKMKCAPKPLRVATTRLAGVMLYESRGLKDAPDEEGRHRLKWHKERADKFFRRVRAGWFRIHDSSRQEPARILETTETKPEDDVRDDLDQLGF